MVSAARPIALVSARAARGLDEDLPPLLEALADLHLAAEVVNWDDGEVDWSRFAVAVLRSTWDYSMRLPEFLTWLARVAPLTRLHNAPQIVRWNIDKHYLADLQRVGVPTVPSQFIEPGESPESALQIFLQRHRQAELVVKPAVGAGSRDMQRYCREENGAICAHVARLLKEPRSALLQPYLDRVDEQGESALLFFDGEFSHAIRKGPLLRRGEAPTRALFAAEHITARTPGTDELALAGQALSSLPFGMPAYARVDLIRDADGSPRVLELELTEPSLFFAHAPGAAGRFAVVIGRLSASP